MAEIQAQNSESQDDNSNLQTLLEVEKIRSFKTGKTAHQIIYFVIIVISFMQGLIEMADLPVQYLFKDTYLFSPAQSQLYLNLTMIAWIVKPVFGFISDNYPLFDYRRKYYLILINVVAVANFVVLALFGQNNSVLGVFCVFMYEFCSAFTNVIGGIINKRRFLTNKKFKIEALLVELSRDKGENKSEEKKQKIASNNISLFFIAYGLGEVVSSALSGELLEIMSKKAIFLITATFPIVILLSGFTLPEIRNSTILKQIEQIKQEREKRNLPPEIEQNSIRKIINHVLRKEILIPLIFIFIFQATPVPTSAMFYFYTNKLFFSDFFMGLLNVLNTFSGVVGIIIYNRFFSNTKFKKIFISSSIYFIFASLTQIIQVQGYNKPLRIPNKLFCIFDTMIIDTLSDINMTPVLVLACRYCPKNIEGSMYSLLLSVQNLSAIIQGQLGSLLTDLLNITQTNFKNLWILIFISNISMFILIPIVFCINFESGIKVTENKNTEEETSSGISENNRKYSQEEIDLIVKQGLNQSSDFGISCLYQEDNQITLQERQKLLQNINNSSSLNLEQDHFS